jgi:hypothetical protein
VAVGMVNKRLIETPPKQEIVVDGRVFLIGFYEIILFRFFQLLLYHP